MSKNTRNRILLTAVAALLLVCVTVGGTLAWLTAETEEVTNTFEPTTLSVDLDETGTAENKKSYTMVPGATLDKDPKVSYKSDVDAWLFVEVTESANLDDFIGYDVITGTDGWTIVPGTNNVYYKEVGAGEDTYNVIQDKAETPVANKVTVLNTVTKEMMDALYNEDGTVNTDACPSLEFKAYIIQKTAANDAAAAWALVNPTT